MTNANSGNLLIDKATIFLSQIADIIKTYEDAQKKKSASKNLVLESRFFTLYDNNKSLIDEMRLSNDDIILAMLKDIEDKSAHFQQILELANENQNLAEVDNLIHVPLNSPSPERIIKKHSLFDDFVYSMIFTVIICLLFSIIWSQYAKTH